MLKKHLHKMIGALVGMVLGFAYWHQIGCKSGTCPITSTWYISTLYGAFVGSILADLLKDLFVKKKPTDGNL